VAVSALVLLFITGYSSGAEPRGQEHPEHPKSAKSKQPAISEEDLADAIQDYVKKDAALKGGYFLIYDEEAKRPLALTLERVHRDRLSWISDDTYFACADFKGANGKTYDIDIFMKGKNKNKLQVTEISIHKEAGKERYHWAERNGAWEKVPAK
jgi:hypothetical protein